MQVRHVKELEFSWAVGRQLASPHRKAAVFLCPAAGEESGLGSEQVTEKKEAFFSSHRSGDWLCQHISLRTGLSHTWGANTGVDSELARGPPYLPGTPIFS